MLLDGVRSYVKVLEEDGSVREADVITGYSNGKIGSGRIRTGRGRDNTDRKSGGIMRISELFRLVWLNINQNKFKSVMTSIGIVVGAATIVMVIGIGRGGQMDIADQFAELNAGAIDVSYEYAGEEAASGKSGGFSLAV